MSEKFLCNLCPRKCNINRNQEVSFCKQKNEIKVARAALHFWEEPCISGKSGSGTVFFSGCSLKCCYCQNFSISHENYGKEISVSRLSEIFLKLQEDGAVNINLVTPTHFVMKIIESLDLCKGKLKIPVVYNSGGYENVSTVKLLKDYVDIYLVDLKYFDDNLALKYSDAENYFTHATMAIREMLSQKTLTFDGDILSKGVIIRHLVLPSHRKDSIKIIEFLKETYGTESYILSLMSQYTPNGQLEKFPEINRNITTFEYNSVLETAINAGFKFGYMQNKSSAENKYTPPFDLSGVI